MDKYISIKPFFVSLLLLIGILKPCAYAQQPAQIEIGEWIQQDNINSNINSLLPGQLLLIDFWATWCGPCIQSMDHVNLLKQLSAGKMYVMHLSNESPYVIERFLDRKKLDGIFASDRDHGLFKFYEIKQLPLSILLNPDGISIWKGHPADLKWEELELLLEQESSRNQLSIIEEVKPIREPLIDDFKYDSLVIGLHKLKYGVELNQNPTPFSVQHLKQDIIVVKGDADQIVSWILDLDPLRIKSNIREQYYEVRFVDTEIDYLKDSLQSQILETLNICLIADTVDQEHYVINVVDSSKLWSDDIITWETGTPSVMQSATDLQGNNLTLEAFGQSLGWALGNPVLIASPPAGEYDWHVQIAYISLLKEQLREELGLELIETCGPIPIYILENTK